jgi:hypothetical protein
MSTQAQSNSLLVPAIVAGIIGGIIVDAFLAISGHQSPVAIWTFVASTVAGQGASPVVGFIAHFVISIVWAVVYAYIFNAIGQLRNWILGTIVLGLVADAVMMLILHVKLGAPWLAYFEMDLIAHVVFFALPVSLYLSRAVRRA